MVTSAKMPPKKKRPADKKTSRVEFVASEAWVKEFRAEAEKIGLDLSNYIRMACHEKKINDRKRFSEDN